MTDIEKLKILNRFCGQHGPYRSISWLSIELVVDKEELRKMLYFLVDDGYLKTKRSRFDNNIKFELTQSGFDFYNENKKLISFKPGSGE